MQSAEEHFGALIAAYEDANREDRALCEPSVRVKVNQGALAVADLIRARDAEIRADERAKVLAGFTEWFAPGFTYPNGRTVPIGRETVVREFAAADARDMASPEDDTPTLVVRRLVGPWEPIEEVDDD